MHRQSSIENAALIVNRWSDDGKAERFGLVDAAAAAGQEWRPAVIGASAVPADSGMVVIFQVDGSINGNGGCNKFFGSLETTKGELTVGELGSTRMACPGDIMDREAAFMNALQETRRFEIGEGSLQLVGADNQLLAELVLTN